MEQDERIAKQPFIPVILGANIGVYSTARSFHEAYGTKSISISRELIGAVKHSAIIQPFVEAKMKAEDHLVACLSRVTRCYPGIPKILIGSADWHVQQIANVRDKLGNEWIVPYASRDILQLVTNKKNFYALCAELNVDYPKFVSFTGDTAKNLDLPFDFPVVIKPAESTSYQAIHFTGKKKVFIAQDRGELVDIIALIREAGFKEELIIQEFIPGDDTSMHILTLYTARDGQTKLGSFGQTLLEDHTPGGIGNPVAIRTFCNDTVVQQAKKLVEHVGYIGFSNFDLKYDERDGKYKFFELNPRLGRSNYYVTAEGHNTSRYYVEDYVYQRPLTFSMAEKEVLYSVVPKRLVLKYIKNKDLKKRVKTLYRSRRVKNPMYYFSVEKSIKRLFYVIVSTLNFFRKFKKYPPL